MIISESALWKRSTSLASPFIVPRPAYRLFSFSNFTLSFLFDQNFDTYINTNHSYKLYSLGTNCKVVYESLLLTKQKVFYKTRQDVQIPAPDNISKS